MAKDIEQLRSEITEYSLNTEMPFPVQNIDLKINPAHISLDILDAVSSLEPFGAGNPQPVFGLYGMKIEGFSPVGNGKHMRITVSKGDTRIFAMYFGMTERSFFTASAIQLTLPSISTGTSIRGVSASAYISGICARRAATI